MQHNNLKYNNNNQCKTFYYTNKDGEKVYKDKKSYNTDKEAIEAARIINARPKSIRKCVAYKCKTCGKWHIGRTLKTLTEKEKEHYRNIIYKI